MAEYARATEDDEFADLEVATLPHLSDRTAQQRLRFARELTERLPRTLLRIVAPNRTKLQPLQITGLDILLNVYQSRADALT